MWTIGSLFPEQAKALVYLLRQSISSQGVSCLLFYDFLITSHGCRWKLTATRLPAEFNIREWEEWIIKGSHLEIMKRSKMPMLIAQGAVGITRVMLLLVSKHYCRLWDVICRSQMHRENTPGSSGSCAYKIKSISTNTCNMRNTLIANGWTEEYQCLGTFNRTYCASKHRIPAEYHTDFHAVAYFLYLYTNGLKLSRQPPSERLSSKLL